MVLYLESKCKEIGIKDYVLVKLNADLNKNNQILYPYALCIALQSLTIAEYLLLLKASEDHDMEESDFDSVEEYKIYLDQAILVELHTYTQNDSAESCTPETFDGILVNGSWSVDSVIKYGFYNDDPRYDDDLLLRELRGLNGNNRNKFLNFCESTHTDRLAEIIESCQITLENNHVWQNHINNIFDYLNKKGEPYRLVINIFSPNSVFDSLIRSMFKKQYEYLPIYIIFVDFINTNQLMIFGGSLMWNGEVASMPKFVRFLNDERGFHLISKFVSCLQGEYDVEILNKLNLNYRNNWGIFENGELKDDALITFKNGKITRIETNDKPIQYWITRHSELKKEISILISKYTGGFF
jgi:hypothetical protein